MILHRGTDNFQGKNTVVTIGTFDGVHLGHLKVIRQLNKIAQKTQGESVLFTFYPHPRLIVAKDADNLRLLTTFDEKQKLLSEAGINHLVIYPFTKEFAKLTYQQFIKEVLIKQLKMKTLVVGHDHRLGKNREGTFENIVEFSKTNNFTVERIETFLLGAVDVSSTKVRDAFQNGKIEVANQYLGYRYQLTGTVTEGNQLGRSIGFPTANIEADDVTKLIPREGVYAVFVLLHQKRYQGMLNIGNRPTVNANADHRTIEVNIFDFQQNIYRETLTIEFVKRIRNEQKFESIDDLKEQLQKDKIEATRLLNSLL